jgi:hypothetical protein
VSDSPPTFSYNVVNRKSGIGNRLPMCKTLCKQANLRWIGEGRYGDFFTDQNALIWNKQFIETKTCSIQKVIALSYSWNDFLGGGVILPSRRDVSRDTQSNYVYRANNFSHVVYSCVARQPATSQVLITRRNTRPSGKKLAPSEIRTRDHVTKKPLLCQCTTKACWWINVFSNQVLVTRRTTCRATQNALSRDRL